MRTQTQTEPHTQRSVNSRFEVPLIPSRRDLAYVAGVQSVCEALNKADATVPGSLDTRVREKLAKRARDYASIRPKFEPIHVPPHYARIDKRVRSTFDVMFDNAHDMAA